MKKYYITPRVYTCELFQSSSIMALSEEAFDLTFDDNVDEGDAGEAASRDFNIWNDWGVDDH